MRTRRIGPLERLTQCIRTESVTKVASIGFSRSGLVGSWTMRFGFFWGFCSVLSWRTNSAGAAANRTAEIPRFTLSRMAMDIRRRADASKAF